MYLIPDKASAIGVMMASLVCIGTFPAIFNYVERRGRKPQHHYVDYCIANFLLAVIFALTLGQIGNDTKRSPNFFTQITQDNGAAVGFALAGGVFLCLGNLLMQYSIPFTGVSISELLIASCNVTVGTIMNYFLDSRINSAKLLFSGVGCFLLAVLTGAFTHVNKENDREAYRVSQGLPYKGEKYLDRSIKGHAENPTLAMPVGFDMPGMNKDKDDTAHGAESAKAELDLEKAAVEAPATPETGRSGLRQHLLEIADGEEVQKIRSINTQGRHHVLLGVFLAIASGCCDGFFAPSFNLSANDQWHKLPEGVSPLSVYCSYFYFTMSFMVVGSSISIYFMYFPPLGIAKTSTKAWFFDNHCRVWSILAGIICGLGNGFQFMAGQAAGYAAADAVQAFPLVGTVFGIFLFKEYHNTRWVPTRLLLTIMIVLFCGAVALLASSAELRKV